MSRMVAELYDALRKAGVDEQLSKEAAQAVLPADVITELATKRDLAELRGELKADFAALRADFAELRADTRAEIATLRADLADTKVELIKWNVGAMAVLTAIFAAISRL